MAAIRRGEELNARQVRFCQEYVVDLNGTRAAIASGYAKGTAAQISSENLTKLNIKKYILELQKQKFENSKVTAQSIFNELVKCGFSNVQDFLDDDGKIKDLKKIKNKSSAVSSIEVQSYTDGEGTTNKTTKFKLVDKLKALELIGRHTGFFKEDNAQKVDNLHVYIPEKKKDPDTSLDDVT